MTTAGGAVPTASHLTLPAERRPSGEAPGGLLGFSRPSADIPVQHRIGPDHVEWSSLAACTDQGAGWNPSTSGGGAVEAASNCAQGRPGL